MLMCSIRHTPHPKKQHMPNSITDIMHSTPTPRLEITTPAVRNPGVTVALEASVSGGGRNHTKVQALRF